MASEAAGTEASKRGHGHSAERFSVQEPNPTGPCPGLVSFSLQSLRTENSEHPRALPGNTPPTVQSPALPEPALL